MGYMFYIWLMIMIITVIIEIATTDLTSIWFAIGALGALIISIFLKDSYIWIQVTSFAVLSLVILILFRPLIKKKIDCPKVATNVDALIGKKVLVIEPITQNNAGVVKAEGIEWTAKTEDDSFDVGDVVEVTSIVGNSLYVKKEK